jgi:hypothetical protein
VFTRFAASGDRIPGIRHDLRIIEDVLRASITSAVGPPSVQKTAAPSAGAAVGAAEHPPTGDPRDATAVESPKAEASQA